MANPIRLGGLVSGLDTTSIINQLLDIEKLPITRFQAKKADYQDKSDALGDLDSGLETLLSAIETLNNVDTFRSMTASSGDDDVITGTADRSAAEGVYNVTINQKATRTTLQGSSDIGNVLNTGVALSSAGFSVTPTTGYFTVNGLQVTVTSGDTITTLLAKISSITSATYNAGNDEIVLSNATAFNIGSAGDTSNFLTLARLFGSGATSYDSNPNNLGVANIFQPINDGDNDARLKTAVTQTSSGSFKINGATITYNTNTDSIKDVLSRINDSDAGVTATFDAITDSVVMTSKNTGALDITVSDTSGNLMSALGLLSGTTKTLGDNASITIEGVNGGNPIISNSNTFTASVTGLSGVSFTIQGSAAESTTLTVKRDTETFEDALNTFIEAYNDVHSLIKSQSQVVSTGIAGDDVRAGILQGDSMLSSIQRRLRSLTGSTVSGATSPYTYLRSIGVWTIGQEAALSIVDSGALEAAMSENMGAVETLFTSTNGIAKQLKSFVEGFTKSLTGAIATRQQGFSDQMTKIDKQISDLNKRLERQEKSLVSQFTAMEVAVAQQQQQLSFLLSRLGLSSGSSSS